MANFTPAQIKDDIHSVIEGNAATVEKWLANEPGSWGALAGKAVIACRQQAGRPLTKDERRLVWKLLWERLQEIKSLRSR